MKMSWFWWRILLLVFRKSIIVGSYIHSKRFLFMQKLNQFHLNNIVDYMITGKKGLV